MLTNSIYLLLRVLFFYQVFIYVLTLSDILHIFINRKRNFIVSSIPTICAIILLIINIFNPILFSITKDKLYVHENLFILIYVFSTIYLISLIVSVIKYRKVYTKSKIISLIVTLLVVVCSTILQYFLFDKYHLLIDMYAISLGLFFLSVTVERPENQIDPITGARSLIAFKEDSIKAFYTKKQVYLITIKILNFSIYGNNDYSESFYKNMVLFLNNLVHKYKVSYTLYSGDSKFIMVMNNKFDLLYQIVYEIEKKLDKSEYKTNYNMSIVRCPLDLSDPIKLGYFVNNFTEILSLKPNEVVFYENIKDKSIIGLYSDLYNILVDAINNDKFEVYYQPIYSVKDNTYKSAEALIRLKNEKYGYISPSLFIPFAEKNNLISQIGDSVFESVCKFISSSEFSELGLDYIEVNLSLIQCIDNDLADRIIMTMKKYDINPNYLNFEITESLSNFDDEVIHKNIRKLHDYNISFSIDDYGTGFSNIKRISSLPVNIIKLDKVFVDSSNMPVVLETIKMLKKLNMLIIVEGIETEDKYDYFKEFSDYIQGFYFSRPIGKTDFISFIKNNKLVV